MAVTSMVTGNRADGSGEMKDLITGPSSEILASVLNQALWIMLIRWFLRTYVHKYKHVKVADMSFTKHTNTASKHHSNYINTHIQVSTYGHRCAQHVD